MATKVKVIATSLADIAIDLLLPTLVYVLLAPTHLAVAIRLTLGGFVMAAKATAGPSFSDHGQESRANGGIRFARAAAGAALACAATVTMSVTGAGTTASIVTGTVVIAIADALLLRADHRHLDGFAVLVLAELVISVVITLVSSDPRFVLARPAVYTAIAGIYMFTTVRAKPFMMQITRPIAAGGNPVRADAFDRAWPASARFRRAERGMTISLGVVLLAEAVLRVAIVYSQPEHAVVKASLFSQLPAIGLLVLWFIVARFAFVPAASKEVDALMPRA
ncbi:MAG TPA: VC0807 family protein [Streptosporangiaceae bacterium]